MSQLSTLFRRITRIPQPPRPLFAPWKKLGAVPGLATDPQHPLSASQLGIEHFRAAPAWNNRIDHLHQAFQLAPQEGSVLEFGVHRGGSVNWLARWSSSRQDPRVFGFDSFEGLPQAWIRTKDGQRYERGHFTVGGLPPVVPNVALVPGFFEASLPPWLAAQAGPIAFLHNDSDLYSSTQTTLRLLNDRIVPGTVIVFDELCDWQGQGQYDNWEAGEWRALHEWMAECRREIAVLSRNQSFAAAIQIVR